MSTVVTDLLGKRVTVSQWWNSHDGNMTRVVTGIVRGVASASEGTFTLLVLTEVVHCGRRTAGALSAFSVKADDSMTEVVLEP